MELKRIRYFHWDDLEAKVNCARITVLGFEVLYKQIKSQKDFTAIRQNVPDLFLIDLSRLPSHGREIGTALRSFKQTRLVPIVFLGGEKEKVERVKKILPDAFYAEWSNLKSTIGKALKSDHKNVITKKNVLEAYSGTPLIQKLGIKSKSIIGCINPPRGIKTILGKLPGSAKLLLNPKPGCDLLFWFVELMVELESEFENVVSLMNEKGSIWILWPKQKGRIRSELTQHEIRNVGLSRGLVDYKVCSFDETWSGLKFTRRKKQYLNKEKDYGL